MYSKNDYRYYLEHRLSESDDYLAHYGVKGMKWKQHKKRDVTFEKRIDPTTGTRDYRIDFNKHKNWSDGIGVRVTPKNKYTNRSISVYNTTRTKWDKKNDDYVYEHKKKGRLTKERAEDGVSYTLDLSKKKRKKKKKLVDHLKPKNQKVEVIFRQNQKTGETYRKPTKSNKR